MTAGVYMYDSRPRCVRLSNGSCKADTGSREAISKYPCIPCMCHIQRCVIGTSSLTGDQAQNCHLAAAVFISQNSIFCIPFWLSARLAKTGQCRCVAMSLGTMPTNIQVLMSTASWTVVPTASFPAMQPWPWIENKWCGAVICEKPDMKHTMLRIASQVSARCTKRQSSDSTVKYYWPRKQCDIEFWSG